MTEKKKNSPTTPLPLTHEELVVINNALNEVCNGLPMSDDEFETRVGFPRKMAANIGLPDVNRVSLKDLLQQPIIIRL